MTNGHFSNGQKQEKTKIILFLTNPANVKSLSFIRLAVTKIDLSSPSDVVVAPYHQLLTNFQQFWENFDSFRASF